MAEDLFFTSAAEKVVQAAHEVAQKAPDTSCCVSVGQLASDVGKLAHDLKELAQELGNNGWWDNATFWGLLIGGAAAYMVVCAGWCVLE